MSEKIWVICEDFGTEGLSEPAMAFEEEETASEAMKLLGKPVAGTSMKLFAVPLWSPGFSDDS